MARKVNPTPKLPIGNLDIAGLARDAHFELREHATRLNQMFPSDGSEAMTGPLQGVVYTVATLPTVGVVGRRAFVSDANATTFASIVAAGGANKVPVYDDGTNWRIG